MKDYGAILLKASSMENSDMRYATQFLAPDEFTFIQTRKGKKIIIVSKLEYGRASKTANVDEVLLDEEVARRGSSEI